MIYDVLLVLIDSLNIWVDQSSIESQHLLTNKGWVLSDPGQDVILKFFVQTSSSPTIKEIWFY